jgi:hypothetical protein
LKVRIKGYREGIDLERRIFRSEMSLRRGEVRAHDGACSTMLQRKRFRVEGA